MSIEIIYPLLDINNYSLSDAAKVNVGSGQGILKLIDDANQFIQDYTNDTGFTYDSAKAEFVGGKVQQKDQRPADATFGAKLSNNENGNWGDGNLNATDFTGTIAGGWCELIGIGELIRWDCLDNFDSINFGSLKLKIKPLYSGNPSDVQHLFLLNLSGLENRIYLRHLTNGDLFMEYYDKDAIQQIALTKNWSPTANNEYEFLICWDLSGTSNFTNVYIDGIKETLLSSAAITCIRDSNISTKSLQCATNGGAGFNIKDFIYFSVVQETGASYTPGYTLPENDYLESKIDLPQFIYSGLGNVQSFDGFTEIESGTPRYILNGKYWTGSAWVISDNSYAQASSANDIDTNISTLTVIDTLDISIIFPDSNSQSNVDNTIVDYTGQIYPTDNPWIEGITTFLNEELLTFVTNIVASGSNEVRFILKKDTTWYYWTGSAWAISDETYAQTSSLADIQANLSTFTIVGVNTTWRAYLHSNDGSTTPYFESVSITFNFYGGVDEINKCIVYGNFDNNSGPVITPFTIELEITTVKYKIQTQIEKEVIIVTPRADGYWEQELIETDNMENEPRYIFNFPTEIYRANVENVASKNFWDLKNLDRTSK